MKIEFFKDGDDCIVITAINDREMELLSELTSHLYSETMYTGHVETKKVGEKHLREHVSYRLINKDSSIKDTNQVQLFNNNIISHQADRITELEKQVGLLIRLSSKLNS